MTVFSYTWFVPQVCLLFNDTYIIFFCFAFGCWKIMILFPTFGTLRNILQNSISKTFCKHNLLFSNITIMKWIHRIQCWKHLNPDLPHLCVTESFGPQLQLVLHNCTWCSTPVTDVPTPATGVATLLLVFQNLWIALCTAHTSAVLLYCPHGCYTIVLHTQVLYHCSVHTGAVPLYRTHWCCTTVPDT